jgi:tetratricopeptide (TPR) repeat protein
MTSSEEIAWELGKLAAEEMRKGNNQSAFDIFNEALSVNPIQWQAYNGRGLIYAGWGNYQKAIEDFKKAIDICSDGSYIVKICYELGNVYESIYLGNRFEFFEYLEKAFAVYDKIIQIYPTYIPARYRRGCIFYDIVMKSDYSQSLLERIVEDLDFVLQNESEDIDTTMKMDAVQKIKVARLLLSAEQ